jgi:hypothetical protein
VIPVAVSDAAQWVGGISTSAAVLVALFGPAIRNFWRRPRLSLQPDEGTMMGDELIFAEGEDRSPVLVVTSVVTNHGRSQADDVEAILTANQAFGPVKGDESGNDEDLPLIDLPVVSRGALQFELGHLEDACLNIPPRASRTLQIAMLGNSARIRKELADRDELQPAPSHPPNAMFCVLPALHADRSIGIPSNESVEVEIQLQARNAKPSVWITRIEVSPWEMDVEGLALSGISLSGLSDLKRRRHRPIPTPRRRWLRDHTPWAIWRSHQVRRELARIQKERSAPREDAESPPRP